MRPAPTGALTFRRFEQEAGVSLAALIGPCEDRCGIYVLHFADSSQHVGQSVDVVFRFATHARHAGQVPGERIVRLDFAPVPAARLDVCERDVITGRGTGGVALRNKLLTGLPLGDSGLDETVGPTEQLIFLTGAEETSPVTRLGSVRPATGAEPKPGSARLLARGDAAVILDVLAAYLLHALPAPVATEVRFSHLNAPMRLASSGERVLARLTVHNVEVIYLVEHAQHGVFGVVNLAPLPQLQSDYGVYVTGHYGSNGSMQQVDFDPEGIIESLAGDPVFRTAARCATVGLMRRGTAVWADSHDWALANAVYQRIDDTTPTEESS